MFFGRSFYPFVIGIFYRQTAFMNKIIYSYFFSACVFYIVFFIIRYRRYLKNHYRVKLLYRESYYCRSSFFGTKYTFIIFIIMDILMIFSENPCIHFTLRFMDFTSNHFTHITSFPLPQ